MKASLSILSILTLVLMVSCGSSNDNNNSQPVTNITELITYGGPGVVTASNMSAFPLSGTCVEDEKMTLSGSVDLEVECTDGQWQQTIDLSQYPNGVFSIAVKSDSFETSFNITKNTLELEAIAFYDFEDANLGLDSRNQHNAVTTQNVSALNDSEQGNVASFNGADSSLTLSDGSFLNDAFTQRTVALLLKTSDIVTTQVIYDEGGATNAFGLKIENSELVFATRVGGQSGMKSVAIDLTGREGQWIRVVASFNQGELKLSTNFSESIDTATFQEIPSHSDTGGLGLRLGSDAFDSSADFPYSGLMDKVMVFSKALTDNEKKLLLGQSVSAEVLDFATFARVGFLDFSDSQNLGLNTSGPDGTTSSVTQGTDEGQGFRALFAGNGSIQLSDGTYFNEEFSTRTYAFYFKSTDIFATQTLVDEGGSTNGLSIRLDNGYLISSARSGGANSQLDLISDVSGLEDQWIKVIVTFDQGAFSMQLDSEEQIIKRQASFSTIPAHSNTGGLGRLFSSDASGTSGDQFFIGELRKFSIYERALSAKEITEY